MLQDHGRELERLGFRNRMRRELPSAYGEFIAGLAPWDWFINPFSFRIEPVPDKAIAGLEEFFGLVQREASKPVGWMIAEEFGSLAGRFHCHALVAGVANLHRRFWWKEAFRRFGRTRIEPFDPTRGAAFYASKYAAKQLGALHFGGMLAGCDLSLLEAGGADGGGNDLTHSVDLSRDYYRLGLGRWHR
ncbi:MAG: hypothetical protein ACRD19_17565 [Terriglobia bacterium]